MAWNIRLKPEDALQRLCVEDFRWKHKDKLLIANPNGGKRSKMEGYIFKLTGVVAGVYDLFLIYPCGGYHGLFLETKVEYDNSRKNTLSKEQKAFRDYVESKGFKTGVYYSNKEFWEIVNNYLSQDVMEVIK